MGTPPAGAGAPSHPPGSCGTQADGSGIPLAALGSASSGLGGRRAGLLSAQLGAECRAGC